MLTKISYLYDRFFVSYQNFTTEHVKVVKNSRFFSDFCSKFLKFQDLDLACQIQGFLQVYRFFGNHDSHTHLKLIC